MFLLPPAQVDPSDYTNLVATVGVPTAILFILIGLYAKGIIPSPGTIKAQLDYIEFLKISNADEKTARLDDRRRDLERSDRQYNQMEAFLKTAVTMTHTVLEAKTAVDTSVILQRDSLEDLRSLQKANEQLAREIVDLKQVIQAARRDGRL